MSTLTTNSCKHEPGLFMPAINPNRCEGKGPCVRVCPAQVLEMGILPKAERHQLTWTGAVKALVHRYQQARILNLDACLACGDCVRVCPEQAITLTRREHRT